MFSHLTQDANGIISISGNTVLTFASVKLFVSVLTGIVFIIFIDKISSQANIQGNVEVSEVLYNSLAFDDSLVLLAYEISELQEVRYSMRAYWFVDGASYMNSIADAIDHATEEIFIADWWLSPEIYLKRPKRNSDYWRLDNILKRKAIQGVRVFVLLYAEVEAALNINSQYSQKKLIAAHKNIKVFRHPDHIRTGILFWANHEKIVVIDQTYAFVGGIDLCYGRWDDHRHRLTDVGSISVTATHGNTKTNSSDIRDQTQVKYWIGKDYANFIFKDLVNLEDYLVDIIDRTRVCRMPWHDIGAVVVGASARDISRHFIQRWNAVKFQKASDNAIYPYLVPKSYVDIRVSEDFLPVSLHRVTCQVLRSVSAWSGGFIEEESVEQSIHEAYIETIRTAQHYIYIENQFFISFNAVQNRIADALYKRIFRAFKEQRVFRVYVVMPLLPAFEGDIGGDSGSSIRAISHWNYASICRGKSSLIGRLQESGIQDTTAFISFHSLRTHDVLNGCPVTELIYVHSKLLISDDRVVICGSANINDRSMIGERDSEIAVIITDEQFETGQMNGKQFPSGVFAGELRQYLFKEHLGLVEPDPERKTINIADATIDSFWNRVWLQTSKRNTQIYDEVFKCIPTDKVTTFVGLKKYLEESSLSKANPKAAMDRLKHIQGHLVDMPLKFLEEENLLPSTISKEGVLPTSVWT